MSSRSKCGIGPMTKEGHVATVGMRRDMFKDF